MKKPPCYGCIDRWVSDKGNCHANCPKYRAYRAENERRYAEKLADKAVNDYICENIVKRVRKKRRRGENVTGNSHLGRWDS